MNDELTRAIAEALHADRCTDDDCRGGDLGDYDREAEVVLDALAPQILTSTDPAVHAALLAALVRAEVLRAQYDPGVKGIRDFPDRRRYVTRWEDVDA